MAKEDKEDNLNFKRISKIVVIVFFINIAAFILKIGKNIKGVTGMSIKSLSQTYTEIPTPSKIFLIIQWILLIGLLLFVSMRDKRIKTAKQDAVGINIKKMSSKNGTDLDTLYNLLKKRKQVRISTIEKLFNIKKNTAMEWCKILESGNLAVIDYPAGGPVLKISK